MVAQDLCKQMKSPAVTKMSLHLVLIMTMLGLTMAEIDEDLHAKYLTMPRSDFIEHFNKQNYSWKMGHGKHIDEKYISCAQINEESFYQLPLLTHDVMALNLPKNFDAREKWTQCETIREIYNQDNCGSCWAFGVATTASDRTCIHKDIHVRLSEQDFECLQTVCNGGDPLIGFYYWQTQGLVTRDCKPYNTTELYYETCSRNCKNNRMEYAEKKHFGEKVYRIPGDSDQIQAELVHNGPIQAAFAVFEDFLYYESGIYVHKFGKLMGLHSVRVIGYGIEDARDYWILANSWGTGWGNRGFAKIQSYQEEIQFETRLSAGLPKN